MTVRHNAVITCNQCGKETSLPVSGSLAGYWSSAPGWLTVESAGGSPLFTAGTQTPEQARNSKPDLCSWECVMLYASQKAMTRKEMQKD